MGSEVSEQSWIDESLTAYILHQEKMEELENNFRQLDIWEAKIQNLTVEKEKLAIEALIRKVSFSRTDIDEDILEFQYMKELAIEALIRKVSFSRTDIDEDILEFQYMKELAFEIREAELRQIEYELLEIGWIGDMESGPSIAGEKDSLESDKLDIYRVKRILSWIVLNDKYSLESDKLDIYRVKRILSGIILNDKDRILGSIYVNYIIKENFKIGYHDRYITT